MWEFRFDMSLLPMTCMEEICNCLRPCNAGKHWNQLSDKGRHCVCIGGGGLQSCLESKTGGEVCHLHVCGMRTQVWRSR